MNIDKQNSIFLLGGHDLEMLTIKELLLFENYKVCDKNLKWGAKLSDYKDELKQFKEKSIYAIELIEDMALPKNYQRIDHHNELADNDASLLQVLNLLNKKPTREQELIIANDVGHIEAMRCMGASDKEIKDIRLKERAIQGVTKEDEAQAQKDIKQATEKNGVYVIATSLHSFSPIVDNFEKRPLLVYGENSLDYYGDIALLKEKYKEQIENKEAYHGRGYFGFDKAYVGSVTPNKLLNPTSTSNSQKTPIPRASKTKISPNQTNLHHIFSN